MICITDKNIIKFLQQVYTQFFQNFVELIFTILK